MLEMLQHHFGQLKFSKAAVCILSTFKQNSSRASREFMGVRILGGVDEDADVVAEGVHTNILPSCE